MIVGQLVGRAADHDDQRVGRRQRGRRDGAHIPSRVAVGQLRGRDGTHQRAQRGRDVVLARAGEPRDPRRNRGVRTGDGQVDPADDLAAVLVGRQRPPQRRRRRRRAFAARLEPRVPAVLRVDRVDRRQGDQKHRHAERDTERGDDRPDERLAAATQGEPQAQPDHGVAGASAVTLPSLTTTSRSA